MDEKEKILKKVKRKDYESILEKIEKVEPGNYCIRSGEVLTIAKRHNNNAINSAYDFFRIGFLKGERAEKAKAKERGKKQ